MKSEHRLKIYLSVFLLIISFACTNKPIDYITLVKDGQPLSRIVLLENDTIDEQAAILLQDFVHRISGATLQIIKGNDKAGDIVIGGKSNDAGEDGFTLKSDKDRLFITSGGDKGSIYGVVNILEHYMGVSYYAFETCDYTPSKTITLPEINKSETPAFRHRQLQTYSLDDPIYKMWMGIEKSNEIFVNNWFVHTIGRIMPGDVYGKEHPEYFSMIQGKRWLNRASQWCLSNPAVFDEVVDRLDSVFKIDPTKRIISVSQNDGNTTYCQCENCKKIYEEEGAISGAYIRFVNKLAERFPDKEISTLAYNFTMKPPKKVKPLPNVNILLCNIGCMREVPLTDNKSGQEFMKALEGWSKISNNIFVWDYGINFDNYISPFPNFHILQKNIQLFKKNNVTMHFSQINGQKGVDFCELRSYMTAKLMWNPYQNVDSLMQSFLKGYYGAAAPYIYDYHKVMKEALLKSGLDLKIYDTPASHKDGMLTEALCETYDDLFDKAEAAVANDSLYLEHVRLSRLSLLFAELETARSRSNMDVEKTEKILNTFKQRCHHFSITYLNEKGYSVDDYCDLYEKRFMPQTQKSLALGAKVIWLEKPHKRYQSLAESALTDGLFGGTQFSASWVGWEGTDGSFILDLGKNENISSIETDFLICMAHWIFTPKKITYSISSDGKNFTPFGFHKYSEERPARGLIYSSEKVKSDKPVNARYIKVEVDAFGTCPEWHNGVGYPAWFFIDEITVL